MRHRVGTAALVIVIGLLASAGIARPTADTLPSPEAFFGFRPGTDRELIDYAQLIDYLETVAEASPRLEMREIGTSELGRQLYVAFLSSDANIARLEALRELNRRLALEPDIPEAERAELIREGRVFVLATLSMHSGEVAPAQSLPIFVHEVASSVEPEILDRLDEVVMMFVPTHNPDGMDMMVEHYRKYLGTDYEGSSLPGVYNRYVGHDNNRDFVNLTQAESRAVSRLFSTDWYPQVHVDKHQMGGTGPRYFVPNVHDPIAEVIDEGLWTWAGVFGSNLANDMGRDGLRGIATNWLFDFYWPGPTETALWKNIISFLTEAASARLASPVFVEKSELRVSGKGLSEYKKSINMPDPWPGGWWRLGDIVAYELSSMRSIFATAARHRAEILRFRNDLCRSEVEKGRTQPPYYFVLPLSQSDPGALPALVDLLVEHGVEVRRLSAAAEAGGRLFEAGDIVVPMSQPYRPFIKEVMERQSYPVRHYTPDGEIIKPYDVATWSLPLNRGLSCFEIDHRSAALEESLEPVQAGELSTPELASSEGLWGVLLPVEDNRSFGAAFAALGDGLTVERLTEAGRTGARELEAGSFMIHGSRTRIARVIEASEAGAIPLESRPELATRKLEMPRIGLVETYLHDMDAGWTRFLFDSFSVPYIVVRPGEFEGTDLAAAFDVLVFPNASKEMLTEARRSYRGRYRPTYLPPEYRGTISKKGLGRITDFVEAGGIVVSWRRSTELFLDGLEASASGGGGEKVELPVRDLGERLSAKGLYVPGSMLQARFIADHPLTRGLPPELAVFSTGKPVLSTSIPIFDMDRRVIATYAEEDQLLSGYAEHEELLAGRPALVWLRKGRGQLVLFGFGPQFRASTSATFKLIFNALLLPEVEDHR
jgi:hypothetical protein